MYISQENLNKIQKYGLLVLSLLFVFLIIKQIVLDLESQDSNPFSGHTGFSGQPLGTNRVGTEVEINIEPVAEDAFYTGIGRGSNNQISVTLSFESLTIYSEDEDVCLRNIQLFDEQRFQYQLSENFPPTSSTYFTVIWPFADNICLTNENATLHQVALGQYAVFDPSDLENSIKDNFVPLTYIYPMSVAFSNPIGAFPFDDVQTDIAIFIDAVNSENEAIEFSQELTIRTISPEWISEVHTEPVIISKERLWDLREGIEDQVDGIGLELNFRRPAYLKVMAVLLPLTIFAVIIGLLFVQEIGSALEVSLGIVLGLWSTQEILLPEFISGFTLIHLIIIGLYVIFAWALAIRFLWIPRFGHLISQDHQSSDMKHDNADTTALSQQEEQANSSNQLDVLEIETTANSLGFKISTIIAGLVALFALILGWLRFRK